MSVYKDLYNETDLDDINFASIDNATINQSLSLPFLSPNSLIITDSSESAQSLPLTDGQLAIGRTGLAPVASTLTGTANEIIVTPASGSITLSTPQPIATTSSPTFANVTDTGLTASMPVKTDINKKLVSSAISLTGDVSGILPTNQGGTNNGSISAGYLLAMNAGGNQIAGYTPYSAPNFLIFTLSAPLPISSSGVNKIRIAPCFISGCCIK